MTIAQKKAELRCTAKLTRQNIVDKRAKDIAIQKRLVEIVNSMADKSDLFVYLSMCGEVDTKPIIDYYMSDKKIFVPKVIDKVMYLVEYQNRDVKSDKLLQDNLVYNTVQSIISIVPMLAFDCRMYRLGYGGGYYDKFLEATKTYSIGIAYDEQKVDSLPLERHDVQLDVIVTQSTTYQKFLID